MISRGDFKEKTSFGGKFRILDHFQSKYSLKKRLFWLFYRAKNPKVILTTLGIGRSTIMDRYIAQKVEQKTKLFVCQHVWTDAEHLLEHLPLLASAQEVSRSV